MTRNLRLSISTFFDFENFSNLKVHKKEANEQLIFFVDSLINVLDLNKIFCTRFLGFPFSLEQRYKTLGRYSLNLRIVTLIFSFVFFIVSFSRTSLSKGAASAQKTIQGVCFYFSSFPNLISP